MYTLILFTMGLLSSQFVITSACNISEDLNFGKIFCSSIIISSIVQSYISVHISSCPKKPKYSVFCTRLEKNKYHLCSSWSAKRLLYLCIALYFLQNKWLNNIPSWNQLLVNLFFLNMLLIFVWAHFPFFPPVLQSPGFGILSEIMQIN